MDKDAKIYLAGHTGLVGSALLRLLEKEGFSNIIVRPSSELDLRQQKAVEEFFQSENPEYVFLAAAKVGGILANNTYRAEFIYDNLMISANVINSAFKSGVKKLLNLGSSCIYPRECPQPMKEDYLLTGKLEPTNEPYAIAKIAAMKMCQAYNQQYKTNFISAMPTNLYGPGDNFDLENSHVLAALIRRFHEAKEKGAQQVKVWGTGKPRREFMYVDDLAKALLFLMDNYNLSEFINIGLGQDLSISELAQLIKDIVGFEGEIVYDITKPDGTPQKLLDVSKLNNLGYKAQVSLKEGIKKTYQWYKSSYSE